MNTAIGESRADFTGESLGAAVCLLAAAAGPLSVARAVDRPHSAATPLAIANQLPLPRL